MVVELSEVDIRNENRTHPGRHERCRWEYRSDERARFQEQHYVYGRDCAGERHRRDSRQSSSRRRLPYLGATGIGADDHNQRAQRMAARLFGAATDRVHRLLHGPCWSGRGAQVRFGERWRPSEPKGLHCHAAPRRREGLRPTTLDRRAAPLGVVGGSLPNCRRWVDRDGGSIHNASRRSLACPLVRLHGDLDSSVHPPASLGSKGHQNDRLRASRFAIEVITPAASINACACGPMRHVARFST